MQSYLYTAKEGESYKTISEKFGITLEEIKANNCTVKEDSALSAGSVVRLPIPGCPKGYFIKIKNGETLQSIAKEHNLKLYELLRANPYLNPRYLVCGQTIIIPSESESTPVNDSVDYYTVTHDYNIDDMIGRYRIKISELQRLNPGINVLNPKTGTVLRLK